jgi:hypothetical protein
MPQQPDLRPRQAPDLHSQPLGDELLIYAPHQGVVHILNRTARVIWEACDGAHTPAAMAHILEERFDVSPARAPTDDVMYTLHELNRLCLITWPGR